MRADTVGTQTNHTAKGDVFKSLMDVILGRLDLKGQIKGNPYALSYLAEADCSLLEIENMHRRSSSPSVPRRNED